MPAVPLVRPRPWSGGRWRCHRSFRSGSCARSTRSRPEPDRQPLLSAGPDCGLPPPLIQDIFVPAPSRHGVVDVDGVRIGSRPAIGVRWGNRRRPWVAIRPRPSVGVRCRLRYARQRSVSGGAADRSGSFHRAPTVIVALVPPPSPRPRSGRGLHREAAAAIEIRAGIELQPGVALGNGELNCRR